MKRMRQADVEAIPPMSAIEALRRNLLHAMLNTVSRGDIAEIVEVQVQKAKNGDTKAAKMMIDMIGASQPEPNISMRQQVMVAEGAASDWRLETRKVLSCLIAFTGPQTTEDVASRLHLSGEAAMDVLMCDWFKQEGGRWHLTNEARTRVLDEPARVLACPA